MLLKLFKYDFKNTKRYCVPLLFALLAGTVIACIAVPTLITSVDFLGVNESADNVVSAVMILSVLGFLMAAFIIIVSVSLFQIMVCVEFYRSLVTDEGYLTFTLPVKASSIIKSKMLNGITWSLISFAALCVSIVAIVITAVISVALVVEGSGTGGGTSSAETPIAFADVLLVLTYIIYGIVSVINGLMLYFTAIFFGSVIAKKNKLVAAIGCIFGANFAYGVVSGMSNFGVEMLVYAVAPNLAYTPYFTVFMLIPMIIYSVVMTVLMYFLLKHMMEKKLNLA